MKKTEEINNESKADETMITQPPQKKRMATWKVVSLTVVVVFGIFFMVILAIGIYYQPPTSTQHDIIPAQPYTPPVKPPVTPSETYENQEFLDWVTTTNNKLLAYTNEITDDLNGKYWYSLEVDAEAQESYVDDIARPACSAFDLDSKHDAIRDEYSEYLYDLSYSSFYLKLAARNLQNDQYASATENLEKSTSYTRKATAHLNVVIDLIG